LSNKNIIHFIGQIGLGGTEKQLYLFLKYFKKDNISHSVVVFNSSRYGDFENKLHSLGVKLYYIPESKNSIKKKLLFLFKLVRMVKPSIIYSWTVYDNAYAGIISKIFNIKSIGSVRGSLINTGFSKISNLMKYACIRSVSLMVINAYEFKNELTDFGLKSDKIKYMPNFVELNNMKNDFKKNQKIIISTIGNLRKNKNHSLFIEIMQGIIDSYPNANGWIIGQPVDDEPETEIDLLDQIKLMGLNNNVSLLGFQDDTLKLLRKSNVFVLTSLSEGTPNAVLEAMSIGLTVVTSNVGG